MKNKCAGAAVIAAFWNRIVAAVRRKCLWPKPDGSNRSASTSYSLPKPYYRVGQPVLYAGKVLYPVVKTENNFCSTIILYQESYEAAVVLARGMDGGCYYQDDVKDEDWKKIKPLYEQWCDEAGTIQYSSTACGFLAGYRVGVMSGGNL